MTHLSTGAFKRIHNSSDMDQDKISVLMTDATFERIKRENDQKPVPEVLNMRGITARDWEEVETMMEYWFIKHLWNCFEYHGIGAMFDSLIRLLQNESLVKEYRFCGGNFIELLRGGANIGDIDLFVVPACAGAELEFDRLFKQKNHEVFINNEANINTPGSVHDIKITKKGALNYCLDIVFRKEVTECEWVDTTAGKNGVYGSGYLVRAEVYQRTLLSDSVICVKPKMTEARREKLKKKGLGVVEM